MRKTRPRKGQFALYDVSGTHFYEARAERERETIFPGRMHACMHIWILPRGAGTRNGMYVMRLRLARAGKERGCVCVYTHRSTGTIDRVTKEVPLRGCEVPVPAMTRKGEVVRREEIRRDRYFW